MWNSRRRIAYFLQASSSSNALLPRGGGTADERRLLVFAGDWFEGERVSRTLRGRHLLFLLLFLFLLFLGLREKVSEKLADPRRGPGICVLSRDRFPLKAFFSGSHLTDRLIATFRLVFLLVSFSRGWEKEEGTERRRESRGIRILRGKNRRSGYSRSTRGGKDGK